MKLYFNFKYILHFILNLKQIQDKEDNELLNIIKNLLTEDDDFQKIAFNKLVAIYKEYQEEHLDPSKNLVLEYKLLLLGLCYLHGVSTPKNFTKGYEIFFALRDNTFVKRYIGRAHVDGDIQCIEKNVAQGFRLLEDEALSGNPLAQYDVGFYQHPDPDYPSSLIPNVDNALQWYLRAARQGNVIAFSALGIMYWEGLGVLQDYDKSFQLQQFASNMGHYAAKFNNGLYYWNGTGCKQDKRKAIALFKEAIDSGLDQQRDILGMISKTISFYKQALLKSNFPFYPDFTAIEQTYLREEKSKQERELAKQNSWLNFSTSFQSTLEKTGFNFASNEQDSNDSNEEEISFAQRISLVQQILPSIQDQILPSIQDSKENESDPFAVTKSAIPVNPLIIQEISLDNHQTFNTNLFSDKKRTQQFFQACVILYRQAINNKEAEVGAEAQHILSELLRTGIGVAKNDELATKWLEQATAQNYSAIYEPFLFWTAENGFESYIPYLIERGVCLNTKNRDGNTPFAVAIRNNNFNYARDLLQANINLEENFKATTQRRARIEPDFEDDNIMMADGNPFEKLIKGNTPFQFAIKSGDIAMILLMLEKGAYIKDDPTILPLARSKLLDSDKYDYSVNTLLMFTEHCNSFFNPRFLRFVSNKVETQYLEHYSLDHLLLENRPLILGLIEKELEIACQNIPEKYKDELNNMQAILSGNGDKNNAFDVLVHFLSIHLDFCYLQARQSEAFWQPYVEVLLSRNLQWRDRKLVPAATLANENLPAELDDIVLSHYASFVWDFPKVVGEEGEPMISDTKALAEANHIVKKRFSCLLEYFALLHQADLLEQAVPLKPGAPLKQAALAKQADSREPKTNDPGDSKSVAESAQATEATKTTSSEQSYKLNPFILKSDTPIPVLFSTPILFSTEGSALLQQVEKEVRARENAMASGATATSVSVSAAATAPAATSVSAFVPSSASVTAPVSASATTSSAAPAATSVSAFVPSSASVTAPVSASATTSSAAPVATSVSAFVLSSASVTAPVSASATTSSSAPTATSVSAFVLSSASVTAPVSASATTAPAAISVSLSATGS